MRQPEFNSVEIAVPDAEAPIGQWQRYFEAIYGSDGSPEQHKSYAGLEAMWLCVVEGLRFVSNPIRKNRMSNLINYLPQLFCLLCGACTKAGICLDDAVWEFFPYICPTCWNRPCICGASKRADGDAKAEARLLGYREAHKNTRPVTLDDHVDMFAAIYHNHPDSSNFVNIYLHLSEEVAEVAQHVRELQDVNRRDRETTERNLRSEIADVFSWVCKLCWRVDLEWGGFLPWVREWIDPQQEVAQRNWDRIRFSALVQRNYRQGCPKCKSRPCCGHCGPWGSLAV